MDFRIAPADKSNLANDLFGGFVRRLLPVEKFKSDADRVLAVTLDRDALKWLNPAVGQIQISYLADHQIRDYVPDFIADPEVIAKCDAAVA